LVTDDAGLDRVTRTADGLSMRVAVVLAVLALEATAPASRHVTTVRNQQGVGPGQNPPSSMLTCRYGSSTVPSDPQPYETRTMVAASVAVNLDIDGDLVSGRPGDKYGGSQPDAEGC
jgi:hypothetical protein